MRIEVLYLPGCPNHGPAVERLRTVLASEGITADVVEIAVNDAAASESLNFLGSPTIRVNGTDVEVPLTVASPAGLSCRTYIDGAKTEGVPPIGLIRRALSKARHGKNADEAFR